MMTTAKLPDSKFADTGEEDIAAIAKQISDHAEAIYQTWKSRGLAPSEILNCHTDAQSAAAASKFGTVLTPTNRSSPSPSPTSSTSSTTVPSLQSIDNNNLEKLVNNFVVEDKARVAAAQRQKSPVKVLPVSIQFALQKFETQQQPQQAFSTRNSNLTPQKPAVAQKPQILTPKPVLKDVRDENNFSDTIETIFPQDLKPEIPNRPTGISTASRESTSSRLQTWPLKNKIGIESKKEQATSNGSSYMDEVAREEELLINALKNNMVISEDRILSDRTLTKKSKNVISPVQEQPNNIDRPLTKDNRNDLSNMSVVDYAKTRYQSAQQQIPLTKFDDTKSSVSEPTEIVAKVRNKFEPADTFKGPAESPRWRTRRPADQQIVPHPELTPSQRQHIRAAATDRASVGANSYNNPVRPFLTRGSVAERVLIFEKCPSELLLDKRVRVSPAIATWRSGETHNKAQTCGRKEIAPKPSTQHTTLQRHIKANRNVFIPRFYFPQGKPSSANELDSTLKRIVTAFSQLPNGLVTRENCNVLTTACELPLYWKVPLYLAITNNKPKTSIDLSQFTSFWKQMATQCHDAASRFVYILTCGKHTYLCPEDFIPLIQDVVDTHEGLTFLKEATEFHSRYVHTVIARIFYCVNRSWSGRITISELRRSNLLSVIQLLEKEEDINQVTAYFSYEHFYVIYCKFWELDRDHDLFIDRQDLTRHNDHALSSRIIDRIFSGAVSRNRKPDKLSHFEEKMSYTEFVWFLLSEEDKNHSTAIEYWFRCMDLDGDGYLSMYELEYFYEEQMQRMEAIGIETLPFEDCLCQMLDMVKPTQTGKISLSDLKRCKMTSIFFDTFFNLEKYLDHEQRDPFASRDHDGEGPEMSDWDRYAAEEYELLVAEEGGDQQEHGSFDEPDDINEIEYNKKPFFDITKQFDIFTNGGKWKTNGTKNNDNNELSDDDDYAQDSDECSI